MDKGFRQIVTLAAGVAIGFAIGTAIVKVTERAIAQARTGA